jgi:hypothetical protein
MKFQKNVYCTTKNSFLKHQMLDANLQSKFKKKNSIALSGIRGSKSANIDMT